MSTEPSYKRRTILEATGALLVGSAGSGDDEDDGLLPDFDWFGSSGDLRFTENGAVISTDPTDIELGQNLSAQETDDGLVLEATDTADSLWGFNDQNRLAQDSPIDVPGVYAEAESGDAPGTRIQPNTDALREGYLVGQAPDVNVVIDPRNYSSDAHAMQACHDQLLAELDSGNQLGVVRIPPLRPDGTEWVIDRKANSDDHDGYVVFKGDDSTGGIDIYPQGWGFDGQQSGAIQLDIDDGSPAFEVRFAKLQGGEIGRLRAEGLNGGEDCEFLRLHDVTAFYLNRCEVRGIGGPSAHGAFTLDNRCYNSYINNCRYNGDGQAVTEGSMFAFTDLEDQGWAPSELKFGPGNSTYAAPGEPYGHAYDFGFDFHRAVPNDPTADDDGDGLDVDDNDIPSEIWISGRYEGYGRHGIYMPEINGYYTASMVSLGPILELGRPDYSGSWSGDSVSGANWEGTCRVFAENYKLKITSDVEMPSTGEPDSGNGNGDTPLVYADPSHGVIEAFTSAAQNRTHLQIPDDDGGSNRLIIPRPQTMRGPVDYPSTFYEQLRYPDGYRREAVGTATVDAASGDGVVELGKYANFGDKVRTHVGLDGDPGEEVRYLIYDGHNGVDSQGPIVVDHTADITGSAPSVDYDVTYEIDVMD